MRRLGILAGLLALCAGRVHAMPGTLRAGTAVADRSAAGVVLTDGTIVVTATSDDPATGRWVAGLRNGAVAWAFGLPGISDVRLEARVDGGFMATGIDVRSVPAPAWLGRVGADGSLVSQSSAATGSWYDDIAASTDAGGGTWLRTGSPPSLHRLALDGTLAWRLTLDEPSFSDEPSLLAPMPDGSVLLAGYFDGGRHLARVMPDGTMAWAVSPRSVAQPLALRATAAGIILVTESVQGWGGRTIVIVRLDDDGAFRSASRVVVPDGDRAEAAVIDASGGVIAAWQAGGPSATDHVLVRVSVAGALDWARAIRGPTRISSLGLLPDGRVVAVGSTAKDAPAVGDIDAWIGELDAAARLPAGCAALPDPAVTVLPDLYAPRRMQAAGSVDHPTLPAPPPVSPGVAAVAAQAACTSSGCTADASEASSCGAARLDLSALPRSLNFCDDAADWLSLHGCPGGAQAIVTSALGPAADTVLELWSRDCSTLLATDDDGGGGRASRLDLVLPTDATYAVAVRQKDGSSGPGREYDVALEHRPCPATSWVERVGSTVPDGGFAVWGLAMSSTGEVMLAGSASPGPTAFLARLGIDGAPRWASSDDFQPEPVAWRAVAMTSDDGALVAGFGKLSGTDHGCLRKADAAGNAAWTLRLGAAEARWNVRLTGVAEAAGGALTWGTLDDDLAGESRVLAARVTTPATLSWLATFAVGTGEVRGVPTSDGGLVLARRIDDGALGAAWVARLDAAGAVAWQRLVAPATDTTRGIVGLAAAPDDSVLLAVELAPPGMQRAVATMHLAQDGSPAEQHDFADWRQVDAAAACPDGSLLILGRQEPVAPLARSRLLLRTGPDGAAVVVLDNPAQVPARSPAPAACGPSGAVYFEASSTYTPPQMLSPLVRLDPAMRRPAACDTDTPGSLAERTPQLAVASASYAAETIVAVIVPPSVTSGSTGVVTHAECSTEPCEPPTVTIAADLAPFTPCIAAPGGLTAAGTGRGTLSYEWDLDYDGSVFDVDATGARATVVDPRPRTVAARVTDSCPWGRQQALATSAIVPAWCEIPDEVSPRESNAPLRASGGAVTRILVAPDARAADYNILVGAIGDFTSPRAGVTACHVTASPSSNAYVALDEILAPGSWLLVSASSPLGEGLAGSGSNYLDASLRPGWIGCGPSP